MTTCIILTTNERYCEKHEKLLRDILSEKPDLFLAHGCDADSWEEAMDMYCVMLEVNGKDSGAFCNTTAHSNEDLDSVIKFAEQWCDLNGTTRDIKVIYVK